MVTPNIKIYRLMFSEGSETVEVKCLGILSVDSEVDNNYVNVHKLPQWMQGKLASLMTVQADPPIEVEGVGRRIDDVTYWIYDES